MPLTKYAHILSVEEYINGLKWFLLYFAINTLCLLYIYTCRRSNNAYFVMLGYTCAYDVLWHIRKYLYINKFSVRIDNRSVKYYERVGRLICNC